MKMNMEDPEFNGLLIYMVGAYIFFCVACRFLIGILKAAAAI